MSFSSSISQAVDEWSLSPPPTAPVDDSLRPRDESIPINRVPNELLATFFTLAVGRPHDMADLEDMAQITSPTTVSHVCSRWREVAISTGSLWTWIILTFPTSAGQVTRVLTWLTRSHAYSLDILLDFRDPDWDIIEPEEDHQFTAADLETALEIPLLRASIGRWRSVELLVDTWAPMLAFLRHSQTFDVQNLESLRLARCNAYFACRGQVFQPVALKQFLPLFGINSTLTRLRHVSLVGVHVDWDAAASALTDLNALELKYQAEDVMPTMAQFVRILQASPSLEKLAVVGHAPQGPPASEPVLLPNVSSFTLGFVDVDPTIDLVKALALPALRELTLENVSTSLHDEDEEASEGFLAWLCDVQTASSPPTLALTALTHLCIQSISIPSGLFERLFGACGDVKYLRFGGVVLDEHRRALGAVGLRRTARPDMLRRLETVVVEHEDGAFDVRV